MISLAEVLELRKQVVLKGKAQPGFSTLKKKVPKNEYLRAKYLDKKDVINSGAIADADVEVLYGLVQQYRPTTIIEIGTWFGTSAMVMDKAAEGKATIYTCDKNSVYVYDSPSVRYYNKMSDRFLDKMVRHGVKADFVFADASIRVGDVARILNATTKDFVFVTHDYVEGLKGWKYMRELEAALPGVQAVQPRQDSCVAYAEIHR